MSSTRIYYFLLLLNFFFFFPYGCSDDRSKSVTVDKEEEKVLKYGLEVDSLTEYKGKVQRNQTLSDLLLPHNISYELIDRIAKISKDTFDVRKISAGNTYVIYTTNDSIEYAKYFIYEKDPVNFVVLDLTDSVQIYTDKKEVHRIEKTAEGVITSSLYETMQEIGIDETLALKLSDVFAWQIDFYTVQKGDNFKVVFEEVYIDSVSIGIGNILAARFTHKNEDYYGFNFMQGDVLDYFDENGGSLRREFLKAPLKFSRISSRYSRSRFHPILRRYRPHLGIDYAAAVGTPVQSVGDGTVLIAERRGANGKYVKIKHNGTYSSGYLHLSRYRKGIKRGVKVKQGQIIGYVGSTGLSTGPHLDYRFWKNGTLVNYLTQKFPPSHPVKEKYRTEFEKVKNEYMLKLKSEEVIALRDTLNR